MNVFLKKFPRFLPIILLFTVGALAFQIPTTTSGTWSGTNPYTKDTPSGLRMSVTFTGPTVVGTLNDTANLMTNNVTVPVLPAATNGLQLITTVDSCQTSYSASLTCAGLGTMVIKFTDAAGNLIPVKNPVLHVSRIGGNSGSLYFGDSFTLTTPGVTMGAPAAGAKNLAVSGSTLQLANAAQTALTNVCSATAPTAGCGSVPMSGTTSQLAFNVGALRNITTVAWNATTNSQDGVFIDVSFDEDFGDAPATYDPTAAASHILADLTLGASVDAENINTINGGATGTPTITPSPVAVAAAADNNGTNGDGADENGVAVPLPKLDTSMIGSSYTVPVSLSGISRTAQLCGWIDFNRSGVFDNPSERACAAPAAGATTANLVWTIPTATTAGKTYARFRLGYTTAQVQNPTGLADSGEVEDYTLEIKPAVKIIKTLSPAADPGKFNLQIAGTTFATDIANTGTTGFKTVYHNSVSNAPDITTATDINAAAVTVAVAETAGTGTTATDYTSTYSCVNAAGTNVGSGTATSASITLPKSITGASANGQAQTVTCTFTNTRKPADISVTKTLTTTSPALAGSSVSYKIVVSNAGPGRADGATVQDTTPSQLIGTTVSCVAAGSATCPSSPTAAGLASGLTIPTLPSGGSVTFTVSGTAPASGTIDANTVVANPPAGVTDPTCAATAPNCNTATVAAIPVTPQADVVTTKTSSPNPAVPGQNLTYTITTKNNGPSDAANVVIKDTLPSGVTFVSADNGGTNSAGVVTWPTIATLANGTTVTRTVVVKVNSNLTTGLLNKVSSTSSTQDPTPANNDGSSTGTPDGTTPGGSITTPVAPSADVVTTKTSSPNPAVPGQNITYTITTKNNGPSDAANVVITDTLPAGTTFVSASNSGTNTAGVVTWPTIASVANGATVTYTVVVKLGSAVTTGVVNKVSSTSSTPDPTPANNDGSTTGTPDGTTPGGSITTPVAPSADVVTTKTSSPNPAVPGQNLTYTITTKNNGPSDAANVVITDTLPSGVTFVSADNGGTESAGVVTWPAVASIANGATATRTVVVKIPSNTTTGLLNKVSSTSSTPDPTPANNDGSTTGTPDGTIPGGSITTPVAPSADVVTTKTSSPNPGVPGQNITYTITTKNNGPSDAANVIVKDTLPAGTTFVSATGGGNVFGGVVTWPTIASLANGASTSYTVVVKLNSNVTASVKNTVSSTSDTPDPTPANNNGSTTGTPDGTTPGGNVTNPVAPSSDVVTTKTAPPSVQAGGQVTYTITTINNGPSDAANVVVKDTLPAGTTFVSASNAGTNSAGVVTWPTITSLASGDSVSYTVTIQLPGNISGPLTNKSYSSSTTPDPTPANNDGSTVGTPTGSTPGGTITTNVVPIAKNDTVGTPANTPVTVPVLNNDLGNWDLTSITFPAAGIPAGATVSPDGKTVDVPGVGKYVANPDGTVTFTPVAGFSGSTSLDYQVCDQSTPTPQCVVATLLVAVDSPIPPNAANDSGTTPAGTSLNIPVAANDTANTYPIDPASIRFPTTGQPAGAVVSPDGKTITLPEGVFTSNADGTVTFAPAAGYSGNVPNVAYTIADTFGTVSAVAKAIAVTVTPTSKPDTATTPANAPVTIDVLANDNGSFDPATMQVVVPSANGTTTVNPDGTIKFVPTPGFFGDTTFTYQVCDKTGQCVKNTVTITVDPPIAPTANPDTASTTAGTAVTFQVSALPASNDVAGTYPIDPTKIDLDPSTPGIDSNVSKPEGTYAANTDGTVTFTPAPGYSGTPPALSYTISDAYGTTSVPSTITVTVTPTSAADTATTAANTPKTISVLANDKGSLDVTTVAFPTSGQPAGATVSPDGKTLTIPGKGTFVANPDGTITFTPVAGFTGAVPDVVYTVKDTSGQTTPPTTLSVSVGAPVVPTAKPDTTSTTAETPKTFSVTGNDVAGTYPVDVTTVKFPSAGQPSGATVTPDGKTLTVPGVGTYVANADGTVTFTPVAGFSGTAPDVVYTVADQYGNTSAPTTITTTVTPTSAADTATTAANTPKTISVLANDKGSLDPTTVAFPTTGQPAGATISPDGKTLTIPGKGTFVANPDGTITFTPVAGFTGAVPDVVYTVKDTSGQTTPPATLSVSVGAPAVPTAKNDTATTNADTAVIIPVIGNDTAGTYAIDPTTVVFPSAGQPAGATVTPDGKTLTVPGVGTYVANADGTVTFTPVAGYSGAAPDVVYTVADQYGNTSAPTTITATVTPTSAPDTATTAANTPKTISVLANDKGSLDVTTVAFPTSGQPAGATVSPDGKTLTIPGKGTFVANADGTITFTPVAGFTGAVPDVVYTVKDTSGQTTPAATLSVSVDAPAVPTAKPDTTATTAETPKTFSVTGNDVAGTYPVDVATVKFPSAGQPSGATVSPDGKTLTVPNVGEYVANPDGTVTFTPATGFSGTAPDVVYTVADKFGNTSAPTTISATVTPTATNDGVTTGPNTPITIPVLANDKGTLDPTTVVFPTTGQPAGATVSPDGKTLTIPGTGTYVANPDGTVTFTPVAGFVGPVPTVLYSVTDTSGQVAPVAEINTLVGTATAPTATPDTTTTTAETPKTFSVTGNDVAGTYPVDVTTVKFPSAGQPAGATVTPDGKTLTVPGVGEYVANPDGTVTFTPATGFSGTAPDVVYTVADKFGNTSAPAAITATVTPTATNDTATTPANTPATFDVIGNDLGKIDPTSITFPTTGQPAGATVSADGKTLTVPGVGTYVANPDGTVTFTPVAGYSGAAPAVAYTAKDTSGQETPAATIAVTVTPKSANDVATTPAGSPANIPVLANDTGNLDPTSVTFPNAGQPAGATVSADGKTLTVPGVGTYVANPDGTVTFTPDPTFSGTAPAVAYTAKDTNGSPTPTATITATVTPASTNDTATGTNGTPVVIPVLANDGGTIDPTSVTFPSAGQPAGATVSADGKTLTVPGVGTYVANPDGTVTFTPDPTFSGAAPAVAYTAKDTSGQETPAATIAVNIKPLANSDTAQAGQNTPLQIDVLNNDLGKLDPSTVAVTANPTHGTVVVNPDGTITYTPATDYVGPDSFTYKVCDTSGQCTEATVTIDVSPNIPPVANPITAPAMKNTDGPTAIPSLSATDSDGTIVSYTIKTIPAPSQGVLTLNGVPVAPGQVLTPIEAAQLKFDPAPGFAGNATFTYTATDNQSSSDATPATVTIPVQAPPVATNDSATAQFNQPTTINILGNDSDLDGPIDPSKVDLDPSTPGIDSSFSVPGKGTFTVDAAGVVTFTPEPGFTGTVTIPYTITDSDGNVSAPANISVAMQSGTINGHAFVDSNGDGIQQAGEPNLANADVSITDAAGNVQVVKTNANGDYSVTVAPGNATADVTDPANSSLTTANDPQTIAVTNGATANATPVGFQPKEGALTGAIFNDLDGDGIQGPNETGLANVTVTVKDALGKTFTVLTDANGKYTLPALAAGPATITVTDPTGMVLTTNNNPQTFNVVPGTTNNAAPVGYVKPSISLSITPSATSVTPGDSLDYKIKVVNTTPGSNTPLTEPVLTVTLPKGVVYKAGTPIKIDGVTIDPANIKITTNAKGEEIITINLPGNLANATAREIILPTVVTPSVDTTAPLTAKAGISAKGGNNSTAAVQAAAVAGVKVEPGVFSNDGVIFGHVYVDNNNNNSYESGTDTPVAGARVYLSNGRYAVTDEQGRYSISDVKPGNYAVRLDPLTAPYLPSRVPDDQGQPGTRSVVVGDNGGAINNEDFPLLAPNGNASKARSTTVEVGPAKLEKSLIEAGAGYAVTLKLNLGQDANNVVITDPLTPEATRGPVYLVGKDGNKTELQIDEVGNIKLGDLAAGDYTIQYGLFTKVSADQALTDPSLNFEVKR